MKIQKRKLINLAENRSALVRAYPFMRLASKLSGPTRKKAFKELSDDREILKAFAEFAINHKANKIPMKAKTRNQLKKHSNLINEFASLNTPQLIRKCCPKKARKIIQRGFAIVPLIIGALASALPSIISSFSSKKEDD